ncbi:MAG: TrkH family potassium uptake protein [Euryarchaeota archaeon]|nr:TrkH family potassium uptake protein [Euryarchaeota archaeon]
MGALLHYMGTITLCTGMVMLLPALTSVFMDEAELSYAFALPAAACIAAGYAVYRLSPRGELNLRMAFAVSALGWALVALIGSLPYVLSGVLSPLDAYFEAMAGFTTTGITMVTPGELPRSMLFWRSLTQWIGGMGIVVLFLALFAPAGAAKLYTAEARTERLEPSLARTARRIFYIYTYLTLAGILLIYLSGSSVFEAVNHGLTAISSGGFSPRDDSYAGMPESVKIATVLVMLMGGTSFALHQRWLEGRLRDVLHSTELRAMLVFVAAGAAVLYADGVSAVDAVFTSMSAVTTTGFSVLELSSLSEVSKYVLLLLLLVGGGYGSTAGGLKVIRVVACLKAVLWFLRRSTSPRSRIVRTKLQGRVMEEEEMLAVVLFTLLYLIFIGIGTGVFVYLGHDLLTSAFTVATAQGNNGLVLLTEYQTVEKLVMLFYMWLGRLELIPVLILFMWRGGR